MPFFKFVEGNSNKNGNSNGTSKIYKDLESSSIESDDEGFYDNFDSKQLQNFKSKQSENFSNNCKFLAKKTNKESFHLISNNLKTDNRNFKNSSIDKLMNNSPILTVKYEIIPGKVIVIYNSSNIYSMVYNGCTFIYKGVRYSSVDQAYQHYKLVELCDKKMEKAFFNEKTTYLYRKYVRRCLEICRKTKKDVIKWRQENGLEVIIQATVEKFKQNKNILQLMRNDRNKIILNAYGEDLFDSCGPIKKLHQWMDANICKSIDVPIYEEPICLEYYPTIGQGKNIQGLLVMLARAILIDNGFLD